MPDPYTEAEYLDALYNAFMINRMKSISIDSYRQKFLCSCFFYAQEKKWISVEEFGSDEAQYTRLEGKLTELGREALLTYMEQ